MITAEEAKRQTKQNIEYAVSDELNRIDVLIQSAIDSGEFEITCSTVSERAADRLRALGYDVVTVQCGMNEWDVKISWK